VRERGGEVVNVMEVVGESWKREKEVHVLTTGRIPETL